MALVFLDDRTDLKVHSEDRRIQAYSWVRLRRGPNKQDIADGAHLRECGCTNPPAKVASVQPQAVIIAGADMGRIDNVERKLKKQVLVSFNLEQPDIRSEPLCRITDPG